MEPCTTETPLTEFARRLRARRTELHLTQVQLADTVGTTRQTVSAWEAARHGATDPMMEALSVALKTTPRKLWPGWKPGTVPIGGHQATRRAA